MAGICYVVLCLILMKKMNLSVNAAGDNFGNGSEHAIWSPEFPACKQHLYIYNFDANHISSESSINSRFTLTASTINPFFI